MYFNGLTSGMGNLFRLSDAKSRSITPENRTGGKGAGAMCELADGTAAGPARELGKGWKVNPYLLLPPHSSLELADIQGPGILQHIWCTPAGTWRDLILRFYWDDQPHPSVECPIGDFFCNGWKTYWQVSSLAVCVNPGTGLNCYWPMPFRKRCRITLENIGDDHASIYYQIDYALTEVEADCAYFHAKFDRINPLPYGSVYTILDGVRGKGQYVGTYLAWGSNNNGWWGEGEVKFYLDGDEEYPTLCGTGTEDYFCGSYNFEHPELHQYVSFSTPYSGFHALPPDGLYRSQMRFGMYRWHIMDPIRFDSDLRVSVQALGWRSGGRYLLLQDDIASVAFWYQTLPSVPFAPLPTKDQMEVL